jgi:hypothetical protein
LSSEEQEQYTRGMWDVMWMEHILNLRGLDMPLALLCTLALLHSLILISLDKIDTPGVMPSAIRIFFLLHSMVVYHVQ